MSPARDMAVIISATGWEVSVSREPLDPSNVITVYDTGGLGLDTDEDDEVSTVQVRVRCLEYLDGYAVQAQIRSILTGGDSVSVEGRSYRVFATSSIADIGRDDNDRHLLTSNFQLTRS